MNSDDRAELEELGWNERFAFAFDALADEGVEPGRLAADYGTKFLVQLAGSAPLATLGSSLREARLVAVGDWVAIRNTSDAAEIRAVLRRQSAISREAPGSETSLQVIAANVDLVFIATSADTDFNLRRIERLLTVAYQSGAAPVIVLTKVDLNNPDPFEAELETIAAGVPVVAVSGLTGAGIEAVRGYLSPGKTAVLVGSSGVGKSTLINRLLGEEVLRTADVHKSGQGRHTTSHRQLLKVPGGGLVIDTPGLREIQLWAGADALAEVFLDIEELALRCRFSDCRHATEPDCAVLAALEGGTLDASRFRSYRKLQRELRAIEVKADVRLQIEERRKWKLIHKSVKQHMQVKRRWD
ncbi:MAG TPA: ribosome small subunit-dependent GTPase A [Candidatus Dormibacteraeota bacterium]|nr:ribosome small subunit-dependent GTPase A [Candidatus Dormibacteraeota bacterium]